jgi:hypothetical protein
MSWEMSACILSNGNMILFDPEFSLYFMRNKVLHLALKLETNWKCP